MNISDLLNDSRVKFGDLLRQICLTAGYTQSKLSRESIAEKRDLLDAGMIKHFDTTGSFEQSVISRIMDGLQAPTYYQVYIWIRVFKRHFASAEFAAICAGMDVECPTFDPEWEYCLWHLSSFMQPDELRFAYEHIKDVEIIKVVEESVQ